ncbi:MAG: hypothetical protein AAGF11_11150 [Myxococcota bacterium]
MMIDSIPSLCAPAARLLVAAALLTACDSASDDLDAAGELQEIAERPEGAYPQALAANATPVAQLPGFDVTIGLDADSHVTLDWADADATEYEIWYSRYPYFTPGVFPSTLAATVTGTSWVDPLERDYEDNLYYVVRTVETAPQISTTVGRHRVTMYDGFSKIPLSLETDLATAVDVFDAASPDAIEVFQFNAQTVSWQSWDPVSNPGAFIVDHGTTPVLNMELEAPVDRIIAGYVPAADDLAVGLYPGDNLVHLPLHFPDTTASALLATIPGATQVGRWDPAAQVIDWVTTNDPTVDVAIPSGADFHVWMGAEAEWPIDREAVSGDCCVSNGNAYCEDAEVTTCVCAEDPYCCSNTWDSLCANGVEGRGCGTC